PCSTAAGSDYPARSRGSSTSRSASPAVQVPFDRRRLPDSTKQCGPVILTHELLAAVVKRDLREDALVPGSERGPDLYRIANDRHRIKEVVGDQARHCVPILVPTQLPKPGAKLLEAH